MYFHCWSRWKITAGVDCADEGKDDCWGCSNEGVEFSCTHLKQVKMSIARMEEKLNFLWAALSF